MREGPRTITRAGRQAPMGHWVRSAVLIDVANLAHAIGEARRATGEQPDAAPVQPDLTRVREVFRHLGIEVTGFGVALPLEPVELLGVRAKPAIRHDAIERSRRWLMQQQRSLGSEMVRAIAGGIDGHGEFGVDAMCVLEAIAVSWAPDVDALVVVSGDADLMVAQHYVTDTPIFAAGSYTAKQRRQLRLENRGWIDLRAAALRHMAPPRGRAAGPPLPPVVLEASKADTTDLDRHDDAAPPPTPGRHLAWLEDGQRIVISSDVDAELDITRHQRRMQAVSRAATVAITDPYDLSLSAGRALGISKLPTPATVEELLTVLGFDLPLAQFAAVPDIIDRFLASADIDQLQRQALEQLDGELEALIEAHREDGDVRTLVSVGRLAAERPDAIDPDLRHIEEKKVLTTLAADVLWALHHTSLPVVVVSDRAELVYLLDKMQRFVPDARQRLVRIGLHARPVAVVGDDTEVAGRVRVDASDRADLAALRAVLPAQPSSSQIVVLNGPCAAALTGLTRHLHGPALLAAIHREISDESVEWRMVRFDASTLGAVLSPVDRPEVEVVFHRMLELNDDIARHLTRGDAVPAGALQVRLQRNDARPCELPTLRAGRDDHGTRHDLAVVVEHRDGALHLDVDGDRRPDIEIAISHGAEAYLPGHTVIYRRAAGPGDQPSLLGPVLPHDHDQQPHVVVANGDGTVTDPDTGRIAALLELPDLPDVHRPRGSRLLAYQCGGDRYQALSTSLEHL